MKSNKRDEQDVRDDPRPSEQRKEEAPRSDTRTYVDDDGTRFYRHSPEPVRAFEVVLNVGDRASNLSIGTPDGIHKIDIEIRAHRQGEMKPVLRVRGQAASDGRLELIVRNLETGEAQTLDVESMTAKPETLDPKEMARQVAQLKAKERMPSFEALEQVAELLRPEWEDELRRIQGLPTPPKPKPN
jgi:hypothetical protein